MIDPTRGSFWEAQAWGGLALCPQDCIVPKRGCSMLMRFGQLGSQNMETVKRARPRRSLRGCLRETHPVFMGLEDWGEDRGFGWLEQYSFHMKSPWDKIYKRDCSVRTEQSPTWLIVGSVSHSWPDISGGCLCELDFDASINISFLSSWRDDRDSLDFGQRQAHSFCA